MKYLYTLFIVFLISNFSGFGQTEIPKGWHLLDVQQDSFYGISLNKAYQFLQSKKLKSTAVTVAVLDSGVDTLQEDLKPVLWHNPKEIPNNSIDDDKNGYVDDYYGWNFLGNKNGESLVADIKENARIYHNYKSEFGSKKVDTTIFTAIQKYHYKLWKQAAEDLDISTEKVIEIGLTIMALKSLKKDDSILKKEMNVEEYNAATLEKYEPKTSITKKSKLNYLTTLQLLQIDIEEKNIAIINQLEEYVATQKKEIDARETVPTFYRKEIIKDDYDNIKDKFYGNKYVTASNSMHGTHVAGIIAAQRNNGLGIDGIADNVKIMPVRIVPDGDEYDKDIALAIFYAVENGAKVINMSFGKNISPEKYWVDSAIKYAAAKDVLLVLAAGNETQDLDSIQSFPSPFYLNSNEKAKNIITVGASTDPKISGGGFVTDFSNYGKKNVDVFAPGLKIYSTVLGVNNYSNQKGTSMAAPVVAGVAALLRSYFPKLSAVQTKNIIEKSVYKPNEEGEIKVSLFGISIDKMKLKDACVTGGIVNAAKAVELAFKEFGIK